MKEKSNVKIIISIITDILSIIMIIVVGFLVIKGLGSWFLNISVKPSTKYVKEETIGNIISITPKSQSRTSDNTYDIKYLQTKNDITNVKTETLYNDDIIIDDTIERPTAVKCYYKKFIVFKTSKIYCKMSLKDFKELRDKTETTY